MKSGRSRETGPGENGRISGYDDEFSHHPSRLFIKKGSKYFQQLWKTKLVMMDERGSPSAYSLSQHIIYFRLTCHSGTLIDSSI